MANLINIRVLHHDRDDLIHIGIACQIDENNLDNSEQTIIQNYEKKTAWCGGFKEACKRYYKRIAIVNAETLQVIRTIYEKKEGE